MNETPFPKSNYDPGVKGQFEEISELHAEIERLKVENDRVTKDFNAMITESNRQQAEIERLKLESNQRRIEIEIQKEYLEQSIKESEKAAVWISDKDAEIDRLNEQNTLLQETAIYRHKEIERLKAENSVLHATLGKLDIYVPNLESQIRDERELIGELADYLGAVSVPQADLEKVFNLRQRAKEII
jgi:chromosome segregation ATPase